jgi:hypothetical protein
LMIVCAGWIAQRQEQPRILGISRIESDKCNEEEQRQQQIPPLRCGMTNKKEKQVPRLRSG